MGGSYDVLVDELASGANIETALGNFNKACVEKWDKQMKEWAAEGGEENDPSILNAYKIYYADGKLETYITDMDEPIISSWSSTLKNTYEQLAFDKATGWSRWLYLNEQLPCEDSPVEIIFFSLDLWSLSCTEIG